MPHYKALRRDLIAARSSVNPYETGVSPAGFDLLDAGRERLAKARWRLIEMNEQEARQATVTATEAARELKRHGFSLQEFQAEVGVRDSYKGATVLNWLGY